MIRKLSALAVSAIAVLSLVPASAHEGHCVDLFILSGVVVEGNRVGSNPGAVSCTLDDPAAHGDTNFTVPGAAHLWGALFDDFPQPEGGTVTIGGGDPIDVAWTLNAVRGRWETDPVDITGVAPGTTIVLTADVGGEPQSVTYTRA